MSFSSGVNRVFLLGEIDGEPEFCNVNDAKTLCFRIMTSEKIKKNTGFQQHLEWHNVLLTYDLARDLEIRSGDIVYIQGKIQTRPVINEHNTKLYKTDILVQYIEKLKSVESLVNV